MTIYILHSPSQPAPLVIGAGFSYGDTMMLSFISGYYPSLSIIKEQRDSNFLKIFIFDAAARLEALREEHSKELEQYPDMELLRPVRYNRIVSDEQYIQRAILAAKERIKEITNPKRPQCFIHHATGQGACYQCRVILGEVYLREHNYVNSRNWLICEECDSENQSEAMERALGY